MKTLSIIIVNYHSENYLLNCLTSLFKEKNDFSFEVIVVDNDEKPTIEKRLRQKFPDVIYLHPRSNLGFSSANNFGSQKSSGKYLFFLNPDTLVCLSAIKHLVNFLEKRKRFAIVAPLLVDQNYQIYPYQGTEQLTPLSALFALSFLNKYFPNNFVSRKFWLKKWNKKSHRQVAVIPGSAFLIRKNVFSQINGFDPRFFLYFEESDLCLRIQKMGYLIAIEPKAHVLHFWHGSTPKNQKIKQIFRQSRFYYFRKNFGALKACMIELFLRGGEWLAPLF